MSLRCLSEVVRQIQRSSSHQRSNRGSSIRKIKRPQSCLEMEQGPWYYKVQIHPPRNFPVIPAEAGIQTSVTHGRENLQAGISYPPGSMQMEITGTGSISLPASWSRRSAYDANGRQ